MAVDEGIVEIVFLDETQGVFAPFHQVAVQIFLGNEVTPAAGNAHHADALIDLVEFRLVFEAPGIKIDGITELAEFACKLKHINHLPPGIGRAQWRMRGDIAMRRYESYPRIAFSFARGCHGSHLGKFFQLTR